MKALPAIALAALLSCAGPEAVPVQRDGLENAYRLTGKVLSGAQPEGEAAFRELADLGVKTVISVDGAKPDLTSAHKHGLRYVHLPIGYDGIPRDRALELAKAIEELPGPIYIHCHHGQHRGPAAAVVACVVAGRMTNDQAVAAMKKLGTGPQYIGLWDAARDASPVETAMLRDLKVEFRETAPVPPMADAMVHLDGAFERLQLCRKAGWAAPADHPDVDPPHEALRAREVCVEILRTDDLKSRAGDFRKLMEATRDASAALEALLRARPVAAKEADAALVALGKTCADCHKPYRNGKPRRQVSRN